MGKNLEATKLLEKGSLHGYNILSLRLLGFKVQAVQTQKDFLMILFFSFLFVLKLGFLKLLKEKKRTLISSACASRRKRFFGFLSELSKKKKHNTL